MNKTIITYGTFDLFHIGHLKLLERISNMGSKLIVGVSTESFNALKGKQTIIPYTQRAEIVGSIKYVDMVIPEYSWEQKINDILEHQVDLFVIGDDWQGKFDFLSTHCEVKYLPRTAGVSTTGIKNLVAFK